MKSEKTAVKNAILYLKDYICAYNERRASDTGRKLLESVNVVIDFFNEIENTEQEEYNNEEIREMFFGLAFGEYRERVNMQEAIKIPMDYYIKRISEHYLREPSMGLRFYKAYRDHIERDRNIENIIQERKNIELIKSLKISQYFKDSAIEQYEGNIEFYTELVKKLS